MADKAKRRHRKIEQVEQARRLKEKFPGLSILRIAKLVDLSPKTIYTSQWYQTIKPVKGYEAGPSRTAEVTGAIKSARPRIAQYPEALVEEDALTKQFVRVLHQVTVSQQEVLNLLAQLV